MGKPQSQDLEEGGQKSPDGSLIKRRRNELNGVKKKGGTESAGQGKE